MHRKKSGEGGAGLGRALMKERLLAGRAHRRDDSWLHTSELKDGYEWGRLNAQSVTEQTSLDDFLATAELAGTEFVAEKLNIRFVPAEDRTGLLKPEEKERLKNLHDQNKQFLKIPRRPGWDKSTSAEALQQAERDNFLQWRRNLAMLEEEKKLILTPYERNLDFWRQLWRVIERSDVVVQIVDARHPLLFWCPDLESYVREVSADKVSLLLLNKADLLTREQRSAWARHFGEKGVRTVFWSALAESQRLEKLGNDGDEDDDVPDNDDGKCDISELEEGTERFDISEEGHQSSSELNTEEFEETKCLSSAASFVNTSRMLNRDELLAVFTSVHSGHKLKEGQITVGLVGYPNVGKSSTINTILNNKKVSVSATPGHTKHFQTLFVEPGLCLCDCPGLVMPSFAFTKAEMICHGILPIDQMRDHVPAVSLVCQNVPRFVLEGTYGINIPVQQDDDPERPPTAEELLKAYGYMRGFMTAHGQPDQSRSARYILKDYVNGKLLYCHPPLDINGEDFQYQHRLFKKKEADLDKAPNRHRKFKVENVVDQNFFHQENVRALTKGVKCAMGYQPGSGMVANEKPQQPVGKPWKKHGNRNKKEKIRRITKHLDA